MQLPCSKLPLTPRTRFPIEPDKHNKKQRKVRFRQHCRYKQTQTFAREVSLRRFGMCVKNDATDTKKVSQKIPGIAIRLTVSATYVSPDGTGQQDTDLHSDKVAS